MTPAEICRRLHMMVDELAEMPDLFWNDSYPTISITLQSVHDPDNRFTLVVGVQPGAPMNDDA
jgi:hypothetical protein